jgi:6-phosphogluconolactonase
VTPDVLPDVEAVAARAAGLIAAEARAAVAARGRFLFAVSGGTTPWRMLELLASEDVPWPGVHLFQADERVVPAAHADRNLAHLLESLVRRVPLPQEQVHAMPVEEPDLEAGASRYARTLESVAGRPVLLDLVHLGLGSDGHTASLVPGDPVLEVRHADVAVTGPYQGRRRMTLTFPLLDRARCVMWVVTGVGKRAALERLMRGDPGIPAGRIRAARALLLTDTEAAGAPRGD